MREKFYVDLPRHFIFNAMNGAIALCRSDPEKAARLIIALAQCLNYSSISQQRVLLDEELEFIESYLYVQSIRFTPRLSCRYTSPRRLKCHIQKYAIFNIVEKALKDAMTVHQDEISMDWGLENQDGTQLWINFNGMSALKTPIKLYKEE